MKLSQNCTFVLQSIVFAFRGALCLAMTPRALVVRAAYRVCIPCASCLPSVRSGLDSVLSRLRSSDSLQARMYVGFAGHGSLPTILSTFIAIKVESVYN